MKVLMINGSPHEHGCTYTALCEVGTALEADGVEYEIIWLGKEPVQDCVACLGCRKTGHCVFDDVVNVILEKAASADGFVFGSPVYYAHPSGRVLSALNRIFYAGGQVLAHKPGAAVVSARRGGTTAAIDVINKYFTINQMPVVSSSYWNMVHGNTPDEVKLDAEGLQTMRNIGHNMAWLIKCISLGKAAGLEPRTEGGARTNFIR